MNWGLSAIATMLFSLLMQGCGMVTICYDTRHSVKTAAGYANQTPLSVDELKRMITEDTAHYKIIVLYDICCEPCAYKCEHLYSRLVTEADTAETRWLFVKTSSGGMAQAEHFLADYGIRQQLYYLRDDTPAFAAKISNAERYGNISRYLTGNTSVNDGYGIPLNYIVDKQGHLKLKCTEEDGTYYTMPMQIEDLHIPLRELDFETVDTILACERTNICTPTRCQ